MAAQLSADELRGAMAAALEAAQLAANIINEYFERRDRGTGPEFDTKSSGVDLVTEYDKRCEEVVLAHLARYRPEWKVVSEEGNSEEPLLDGPTWIVDPIDGTTSFVHGSFDCCVSIGVSLNRKPVLGVVNAPRLREVFTAIVGQGAFCNGRPIHVSSIKTIERAIACTHSPYNRRPAALQALSAINTALLSRGVHAVRSYGSAALDLCSVACGRLDLYFEVGPWAWDVCAGAIILTEAGGVIHDVDSTEQLDLTSRGFSAASAPELSRIGVEIATAANYRESVLRKD